MNIHSNLSPSKRHRWAICPASVKEEAKYPESENNEAAIDGTHSHTLLEHCIKSGLMNPCDMVGVRMKDHFGEFIVDSTRASRVKYAVSYVKNKLTDFSGEAKIVTEEKVNPKWLTNRDDLFGTVDVQIITNGGIELIDYKDGSHEVAVVDNLQLEQYAIGKLSEFKLNRPQQFTFSEVTMTIIQPKMVDLGKNPITSWVISVKDLFSRIPILINQAKKTDEPDPEFIPGKQQCMFCKARGSCRALVDKAVSGVGLDFKNSEKPSIAQQAANKNPTTLSNDQLREVIEGAPLIRHLLDAVQEEAFTRLERGEDIPGLKLVNGRSIRVWSLPEEDIVEKLSKMGIPKSLLYEKKLLTPSKIEKLTWEKSDKTISSLSNIQIKRMNQEYITKILGKLTVALSSDERPAIEKQNASSLFTSIEKSSPEITNSEILPSWLT